MGDELTPGSESRRNSRGTSPDASTREDEDPEAVERRRQARQEILERGRILEERRRSKQGAATSAKSFDDLVDKNGALKTHEITAMTTAAEPQIVESGLRHRHNKSQAAALGAAFVNPSADEVGIESPETLQEDPPSRSGTPTQPISPTASPPVPPKPVAYQPQRLLIDTDELSNHPSEQLLDLTPTTSASSASADLAELSEDRHPSKSSFWSVNEWAHNSAQQDSSSPPHSEAAGMEASIEEVTVASQTSGADSGQHASQVGSEDLDIMSDDGARISTPGSWTEVCSQISED